MKIFKTDIYSIELTKEEYLNYCENCNKRLSHIDQYDLDEIEDSIRDDEIIVINENMIGDCEYGFIMYPDDFWNLINSN